MSIYFLILVQSSQENQINTRHFVKTVYTLLGWQVTTFCYNSHLKLKKQVKCQKTVNSHFLMITKHTMMYI